MCGRGTTEGARSRRAAERLAAAWGLRERLSPARWRHSLSVAETAVRLAEALGWEAADRERVLQAALLHDVAKELSGPELMELAGADPDPEAREGPEFQGLVHARAGARLAERELGIRDAEVLRAIAFHPTGSPDPSALVQVVFVADYLEPRRSHLDAEDRALLARGLSGAAGLPELFCRVLRKKLAWVRSRNLPVHPHSVAAWNAHCVRRG